MPSLGFGAGFVHEQNIVIAVRIKRRVKVNKIDGLVLDVFAQYL
jgi:hypothetical protein